MSTTLWYRLKQTTKIQLILLLTFLALLWALEVVDTLFLDQALNRYGVHPRDFQSLVVGVLFMPFLHGSMAHLAANSVPLFVLGWLVMTPNPLDIISVSFLTVVGSGLGTWLIGSSEAIYIGSSGLVFGYFGFLLLRGFYERRRLVGLIALVTAGLYRGLFWGLLPQRPGISWEAHLTGFLSGLLAAWLFRSRPETMESVVDW